MLKVVKSGFLILLSMALLAAGLLIAGIDEVVHDFRQFPLWAVIGVLIAFSLNLTAVSIRLGHLLGYFGVKLPYPVIFKASLQGHFASLFFISLFGQVAGRQMVLRKYGTPSVFVASLTAIERGLVFIISGGFCLLGIIWLFDKETVIVFLDGIPIVQIIIVAVLGFVASLWFGISRFEGHLLAGFSSKKNIAHFIEALLVTLVAHLFTLSAFMVGGIALAPEIGIWELLAAATIVSFAASLPISVNGWGIREIAAVFVFGYVGVAPSSALAISILVGLCSVAVVLAASPYVLRKQVGDADIRMNNRVNVNYLPIEKMATWILVTASSILIFFQIHVPFQEGVININLADAFAILAFASVALHVFFTREVPRWSISELNYVLVAISFLLLLAFLHGMQVIGVTQWALTGRLFGWLVILGYLCMGILVVSYLGLIGVKRIFETIVATAAIIVVFQLILHFLIMVGLLDKSLITHNFEGFSGNRNAFAFLLLVCSVLLLSYRSYSGTKYAKMNVGFFVLQRNTFVAVVHGVILAGLVFTGSRAGIVTGIILLLFSFVIGFTNRRMLIKSVAFGALLWMMFVLFIPWVVNTASTQMAYSGSGLNVVTQSRFSTDQSDSLRWESIQRGFDMWRDAPVLGAGLGVFVETSTLWSEYPMVIHSTPVWILAEFGLLGAIVFVAALAWILALLFRSAVDSRHRTAIMLLLVFVVFGLVHEIFYQRIFWMVLGLSLAMPFYKSISQLKG